MPLLLPLFFLVASVKEGGSILKQGCAADAEAVATLPAGAPLTIRYALAGESVPCYKVAVQVAGNAVEGYLAAAAIHGLDDFENGIKDAQWLDTTQIMGAIRSSSQMGSLAGAAAGNAGVLASTAASLIASSQPVKALQLLEPELKKRSDPTLLALGGVAAWRSDDPRRALELWRNSLDLQPNSDLESLYRRVEREAKSDQSTDKLFGIRVLLRYDASVVTTETARQMVSALDEEFLRISSELGCTAEERIVAIVQGREAYRKTTDTAEWNGGQYDGRIRVPVLGGQGMDAQMRRTFAHETTHACLSMLGRWPAWLQEGLAQKLSGDTLTPAQRRKITEMAQQGRLPRLSNLRQDWSRLDTEHAVAAYALSLAAVELFYENYKEYGVRNLVNSSARLADITADLDKRLGL